MNKNTKNANIYKPLKSGIRMKNELFFSYQLNKSGGNTNAKDTL